MTVSFDPAAEAAAMQTAASHLQGGRPLPALAVVRKALASGLASDRVVDLAAMLTWRLEGAAAAIGYLRTLHERRLNDRAACLNLAGALSEVGDYAEVEELLAPLAGDPAADRIRAFVALNTGDLGRAERLYRGLVAINRDDVDSWNNLGNVLEAANSIDEAVQAFERAITLRPDDERIYLNLARVLERADRRAARLKVVTDAAKRFPNHLDVLLTLGLAQAGEGMHAEAEAAFRRVIARAPDWPAGYLELGTLLENRNDLTALDELAKQAESNIGPEASFLTAMAALRSKRYDEAADLANALPATINPVRRLHLQAQIADKRGDYARAFALYADMNAASHAAAPPLPSGPTYREGVVADTAALAALEAIPTTADASDPRRRPIFIVGFPRSGTTLLDALLGSLPDTLVLEERPPLHAAEVMIGMSSNALTADDAGASALRDRYFEVLDGLEVGFTGQRLIDKHPLHMARAPMLHRLFPGAPILFVERHPYDVVLSCFMANFELNPAMRSFVTIEEAARTYDAVFSAWTMAERRLTLDVHRVRYERLVATPTEELASVLQFLGIDHEAGMLDHRAVVQNRGYISTASYAQVGEPIYQRSVARWRSYADQLAPVIPILAPWARRMGYDES